jgi:hypothetical protein
MVSIVNNKLWMLDLLHTLLLQFHLLIFVSSGNNTNLYFRGADFESRFTALNFVSASFPQYHCTNSGVVPQTNARSLSSTTLLDNYFLTITFNLVEVRAIDRIVK